MEDIKFKPTILIVDDTPENIDILREALSDYNKKVAVNGELALKIASAPEKPDLILLDVMMPGIDGFEVCSRLKENPETSDIPIIFMTALTSLEDKLKGFQVGGVDYITKPIQLEEVLARVETHLKISFLQKELANLNNNLERKVYERTKELENLNKELLRAKKVADEMNRLKSYFLSNVSHEMRTPLISILGFAELLLAELEDEEHIEFCKHIMTGGNRLKKTVEGIIALQELEKKKNELNVVKVEVKEFLEGITENFENQAKQKGISLRKNFPAERIFINTDSELLKTAIGNILDNSIKYTNYGSIDFSFNLFSKNNLTYLNISIEDTGIGIDKTKIDYIFQPFGQESEGLSRSFEGMGIGLTVTQKIIELLNGEINLTSEKDKGTKLNIILPALPSEDEISNTVQIIKTKIKFNKTKDELRKPRVLLVEDNYGNRFLLKKYLSEDFRLDEAEEGIKAIAMAEIKKYDIVLMDINLGTGIDGIETFKRIRDLFGYGKVPVIALTAYGLKEEKQKFLDLGFDDYLMKPLSKNELLEHMNALVSKR